ncbi:hypothetical protein BHM03_00002604 [Ensete ventricosum]|nr:hypothetical protein BHM03_00002604 [Ensete ventricosum]
MARNALAPCCCSRTSSIRLGHILRDKPTDTPNLVGQAPRVLAEEASMMLPTLNRYWRLFNNPGLAPPDPGLSPITPGLGLPGVTTEAFLGLTQQVQMLIGMIQAIVPYIPQLAQASTHQHPHIPQQTVLDEVQRDFVISKEEIEETTKGGSPFAPEIWTNLSPPVFDYRPWSTDPTEHVAAFRAQMALYDTSDELMCHTFPTTLCGPAQMWYNRIKSSFITSFD